MTVERTNNFERFLEEYTKRLAKAVTKRPEEFRYGPEKVPEVALKMTEALRQGAAHISPTVRSTARDLGVGRPGIKTLREFLREDTP